MILRPRLPQALFGVQQYYVYILANRSRRLYVGVTRDLRKRLWLHRQADNGFAKKDRITRLVYFEIASQPLVAIGREKQLKAFRREKKVALIAQINPGWDDLAEGLGIGAASSSLRSSE